MNHVTHNSIVSLIWNIADDVLRDVILPMAVPRRLDCLLEPTKKEVLERVEFLDQHGIKDHSDLAGVTGYPFYNESRFTFRTPLNKPSQIRGNFEAYLDGFSENVQEIIEKFKLRNQITTLHEANRL